PEASPAAVAHLSHIYGLDDPIFVQYGRYMRDLSQGNLGFSFVTRRPVRTDIASFLPATVELAGYALVAGFVLALVTATLAPYRRGGAAGGGGGRPALAGRSLPAVSACRPPALPVPPRPPRV